MCKNVDYFLLYMCTEGMRLQHFKVFYQLVVFIVISIKSITPKNN